MRDMANAWAVVLAGGDGARLRSLTTTREGLVVPKQYCSFGRPECLLQNAVTRAQSVVSHSHVCSVVAASHRRWWNTALSNLSEGNIFVQPQDRGSGCGILLALLRLQRINPHAVVTLLPADHYFHDEAAIIRALRSAANLVVQHPRTIYLLGTQPDGPDSEVGYILPAERVHGSATAVVGFTEKPELSYAHELFQLGARWNLFILVGDVGRLLELFEESHSRAVHAMNAALDRESTGDGDALGASYESMAPIDFARDVLELQAPRLQMMDVPRCGWTDLGTRQRIEAVVRSLSASGGIPRASQTPPAALFFDLGAAAAAPRIGSA